MSGSSAPNSLTRFSMMEINGSIVRRRRSTLAASVNGQAEQTVARILNIDVARRAVAAERPGDGEQHRPGHRRVVRVTDPELDRIAPNDAGLDTLTSFSARRAQSRVSSSLCFLAQAGSRREHETAATVVIKVGRGSPFP
ncbi:MAG: hypothetical protein FWD68_08710 [Alphaproteobacteria bacterium]|nr:hypothetical protein [Alphaproteobacteria bacterium]